MAARSKRVPRFNAEMTPMEIPMTSQMIAAPTAREKVTGNLFRISGSTGWLLMKE